MREVWGLGTSRLLTWRFLLNKFREYNRILTRWSIEFIKRNILRRALLVKPILVKDPRTPGGVLWLLRGLLRGVRGGV